MEQRLDAGTLRVTSGRAGALSHNQLLAFGTSRTVHRLFLSYYRFRKLPEPSGYRNFTAPDYLRGEGACHEAIRNLQGERP